MQRYLLTRLLQLIPTLLLASILIFLIIQLAPGDPAVLILGTDATEEELTAERARLGLDKSMPIRYLIWFSDVARLNLGQSAYTSRPVTDLIASAFPNTMKLALTSMGIALVLGVSMGALAALRQDTAVDVAITGFNALGLSIPGFWLGLLMILLFSVGLNWLPPSGVGDPDQGFVYNLRYLVMPVVSLCVGSVSVLSRFTRSALIDVLSSDYIRTARAKGLRQSTVISRHALKNALIPVVTVAGILFGHLLGGAVVTESVFAYPGMGRLAVTSIMNRDFAVVQGTLLAVVLVFILINLVVDISYVWLDPRIKLGRAR